MEQPILEGRQLSKSFGGVQALRDVHLAVLPGDVHAILGENGAGKSTLIKILTGLYQPDHGTLLVDGQPVRFADPRAAQARGIVAIYQEPSLFPDLDVAENIFVGRQPARRGRIAWSRMYQTAAELLRRLGLRLDPRTRARDLSIAQQHMVEIARAISIEARVLIMDEPTSSLTPGEVDELLAIVRQLRAAGTAIIFISHRLEELFAIADRVTVLRDGAVVGTHPMAGMTRERLIQMMVGRPLGELFPKQAVAPGAPLLEVRGLSLAGQFADISFTLRRGEIVGLAGLIGAGRTAVARALFGIEPATAGTILLDGQPVTIGSPREALALGIGYVPEDRKQHGLILPMSIASNISLPILGSLARYGWIDRSRERQRAQQSAAQLEIKLAHVDQPVGQLSGGNQQKVVLAKWLGTQPRILILDEPTRGIDVGTKAAVHRLMSELAAQGLAILLISSELPEILAMSDRILVMREGRLTAQIERAAATQETIMAAATAA
ncbi:sugar ABC transporter ATP-binding protein [Kallotenue papyrolyticum]|uniref:sugar ABC transporter ATP-binding protein n=1 Tax=Kallotenue papyrolyticum TaxID=1325125 RepID=UPI0004786073|nr:sugar ABC transporter ATP-binding protein [Kallotenue papyrolyticum]